MKCPRCNGTGRLALERTHVGDMILTARIAMGLTQEKLAASAGLSAAQVSNIERGKSDITLRTLALFATALKCKTRDLVP